jgi:hypothetical protein
MISPIVDAWMQHLRRTVLHSALLITVDERALMEQGTTGRASADRPRVDGTEVSASFSIARVGRELSTQAARVTRRVWGPVGPV